MSKTYHTLTKEVKALEDINISVNKYEILGVVGASGCGKSTLLNILTNLETYDSGCICCREELRIGYMMQNDALLPWLTVYNNAILGLKLRHEDTKENIEYVNTMLRKYDLYDFKDEYPTSLSGGMRQRVL